MTKTDAQVIADAVQNASKAMIFFRIPHLLFLPLTLLLLIPSSLMGGESPATITLPLKASWETEKSSDGVIRWTGALSNRNDIRIDVDLQGVKLEDYDEALITYRTNDAHTAIWARIDNWPDSDKVSNWYLKDRDFSDSWSEWRFQLRRDDDGEAGLLKVESGTARLLFLEILGSHPPTPEGKSYFVEIGSLTLIRNPVHLDLQKDKTVYEKQGSTWITKTPVVVSNPSNQTVHATLMLDISDCKLHEVGIENAGELERKFELPRNAEVTFSVVTAIDEATQPGTLIAERVGVRCEVEESPGISVNELMGARVESLWPTRPAREETQFPTPEQTRALVEEKAKINPGYASMIPNIQAKADASLDKPVEVLMGVAKTHLLLYLCPDCSAPLTPIDPTHHRCTKEDKIITDPQVNNAYLSISHTRNFAIAYDCALAYQMTGDEKYARKAIEILSLYGEKYQDIPSLSGRSTATGAKLAPFTLLEAFVVPKAFEAYRYIASSKSLSENERKTIIDGFLLPSARTLQRHSSKLNQQAEHFRWIIMAGLWGKDWNMVGESLSSRNGYYDYLATGFTKDGIGTEGGAYAAAQIPLLSELVEIAAESGVNLVTPTLKAIFDAPVLLSPDGIVLGGPAYTYESFYSENPNPAYLATLNAVRAKPNLSSALSKVAKYPPSGTKMENSSQLTESGYTVLRRNTPAGHLALMINHGMQWERLEYDRSHFKLFVDGKQVSRQIGRMNYGAKYSSNMYASWAHNMMTVDLENADTTGWNASEVFEKDDIAAVLLTSYPNAPLYKGIRQQRLAAIIGPLFFVADQAVSTNGEHRFDWHYYPEEDTVELPDDISFQPAPVKISDFPAGDDEHLPIPEGSFSPGQSTTGKLFSAIFRDKSTRALPAIQGTFLSSSAETEFLSASVQQYHSPRLHPFIRLTQRGSSAWIASTFAPLSSSTPIKGEGPEIRVKLDSDTAMVWEVVFEGSRYWVGFNSSDEPVDVDGKKLKGPIIAESFPGAKSGN